MGQGNFQTGTLELKSASASALKENDSSSFTSVTFPTPFPDGSKVIVIPMTQTFNGADTPGIRIDAVTTKGFKIRLNELVSSVKGGQHQALSTGIHASETIGWVAFPA